MKSVKSYNPPHMTQIKTYLIKSKLFSGPAVNEMELEVYKFRIKRIPKGTMIWKPGLQSNGLIVILKGCVTCLIKA